MLTLPSTTPLTDTARARLLELALRQLQECGWSEREARRLLFARLLVSTGRLGARPQWTAVYRPLA